MAFFEQIGRRITDAGQGVAQQTKNLTETARLNNLISANKKKMSQLLWEMGQDYYQKHRKDTNCEEQVYIDQVNDLFREIVKCQKEIDRIKSSETCRVCGARLSEGMSFCMSCGAGVTGGAQHVSHPASQELLEVCPVCGEAVTRDSLFCISCGTRLDPAAV